MATGWASPSKENLNFARLCRLLIDGGTRVLRHVFDTIHPPSTLHTVLHSTPVYTLLRRLRAKKVLTVHQWDELYPITTRVTSGSFDITLLVVLLRNICSLTPPPTGWYKPPAASDLSKEADLARISLYRNEVYGHITQTAVSDADFEKLCTEISAVLIRLIGSHYQPDIDRLIVTEPDSKEEKYLIKMLEEWEETERSIKTAIKDSEQRVMGKLGAAIKGKAAVGDTITNVQSLKDLPGEEDDLFSRAQGFVKKRKLPGKEETSNEVWTLIAGLLGKKKDETLMEMIAGLLGRKKDERLMEKLIAIIKPEHSNDVIKKLLISNCLYEYKDDEFSKRIINKLPEYFFGGVTIHFASVNDIDCLAIRYLLHIVKLLNDEHTGKHLTSTQSCNVNTLCIAFSSLSPSGVSVLCESLSNSTFVTRLTLSRCKLDDECVKLITQTLNNTRIINLDLGGNRNITAKGIRDICAVLSDCSVEKLDLSWCGLDDECVKIIAQTLNKTRITHLSLGGNSNITAKGIRDICAVLSDCSVEKLTLSDCELDDECVKIIAQTLNKTTINYLDLTDNNITDEGVMCLCTVISKSDCRIKEIDLRRNDKISDQCQRSVQNLVKQNKPDAKISFETRRKSRKFPGILESQSAKIRAPLTLSADSAYQSESLAKESKSAVDSDSYFEGLGPDTESSTKSRHSSFESLDSGPRTLTFPAASSSLESQALDIESKSAVDSDSDSDIEGLGPDRESSTKYGYSPFERLGRGPRRLTASARSPFESQGLDIEETSSLREPSLTLLSSLPVDSAIPVQALPRPDTKSLPVESTSTVTSLMEESPTTTSASDQQTVTLDFEGGFHDLSPLGVLLEVPQNAVTCPTNVTCRKLNSYYSPAPATDDETLVSYLIEFTPTSLQKPIIVTLMHCGPSKKEGYETLVKALKHEKITKEWEQIIEETPVDSSFVHQHFKSGYIQVKVSQLTTLAVVSRVIRDTFKVTEAGCVVRSSVCDDVTLEFPVGAVGQTFYGTMKLYCIPDHTEILDGITAFPCPLIVIDGFEGITFNLPVKIRLPHPYPAGYPSGDVRVLCMKAPHEWKDITDQVHCTEHESFLELEVEHFTGYWVWIAVLTVGYMTLQVAPSLSQYLFKHPQYVCFAVFKENNPPDAASLRMALSCVPNIFSEQFNSKDPLKGRYNKVVENTSNKPMRPDDKAYIKVGGCYKIEEEEEEDIFLQFIENDVCKKEPLLRKNNEEEKLRKGEGKMTISFLKKKDGDEDKKNLLCKFCIDEVQLHRELTMAINTQSLPNCTPDAKYQRGAGCTKDASKSRRKKNRACRPTYEISCQQYEPNDAWQNSKKKNQNPIS